MKYPDQELNDHRNTDHCIFLYPIKNVAPATTTTRFKYQFENLSLILIRIGPFSLSATLRGMSFELFVERIRKRKEELALAYGLHFITALRTIVITINYIYIISVIGEKKLKPLRKFYLTYQARDHREINSYKRELNFLRKSIKPAKKLFLSLC